MHHFHFLYSFLICSPHHAAAVDCSCIAQISKSENYSTAANKINERVCVHPRERYVRVVSGVRLFKKSYIDIIYICIPLLACWWVMNAVIVWQLDRQERTSCHDTELTATPCISDLSPSLCLSVRSQLCWAKLAEKQLHTEFVHCHREIKINWIACEFVIRLERTCLR